MWILVFSGTLSSHRKMIKSLFIQIQQCIITILCYNTILTRCIEYAKTEQIELVVPELTEQLLKGKQARAEKKMRDNITYIV